MITDRWRIVERQSYLMQDEPGADPGVLGEQWEPGFKGRDRREVYVWINDTLRQQRYGESAALRGIGTRKPRAGAAHHAGGYRGAGGLGPGRHGAAGPADSAQRLGAGLPPRTASPADIVRRSAPPETHPAASPPARWPRAIPSPPLTHDLIEPSLPAHGAHRLIFSSVESCRTNLANRRLVASSIIAIRYNRSPRPIVVPRFQTRQ